MASWYKGRAQDSKACLFQGNQLKMVLQCDSVYTIVKVLARNKPRQKQGKGLDPEALFNGHDMIFIRSLESSDPLSGVFEGFGFVSKVALATVYMCPNAAGGF